MRQINQAGLDLIKQFEGLRLFAYKCPAGVWTIGYGHTGPDVHPKLQITKERADMLLQQDVLWACKAVADNVKVALTDNQFSALVSLVFNIGESAFKKSTILRMVNEGRLKDAQAQFARWNKVGGVPSIGLTRRRKAEAELWAT